LRYVKSEEVMNKLEDKLLEANISLNPEVIRILENYSNLEIVKFLLQNAEISSIEKLPLCQDTGIVEFFVEIGNEVVLEENISSILNKAVERTYKNFYFRYSVVSDPLFERKNTFSNTPCIINLDHVPGNGLKISFLIKGGGSENLTTLKMFSPSASEKDIEEFVVQHIRLNGGKACPPLHIGIGIGGTAEKALLLSKKALLKSFGERNKDTRYRELEERLFEKLNNLAIGFQALKTGPTIFSVNIEAFPTHIATLPVAISVNCYLCRKGVVEF